MNAAASTRHRSLPTASVLAVIALFLGAAQSASALQDRGGNAWSSRPDFIYVHEWRNGTVFSLGDTLRVRQVLYNGADTANTVFVRPCGFQIVSDGLTLEPIAGVGECSLASRRVQPGDSVWAEMAGVIASSAGHYRLTVDFLSLQADPSAPRDTSWIGVEVAQSAAADRARAAFYRSQPMPKLPYLLYVTGDTSRTSHSDVRAVVDRAMGPGEGYLPYPVQPGAAAAISMVRPYLRIEVDLAPRGRYQISTAWVSRPDGASGAEKATCMKSNGGGTTREALFGAILFDRVNRAVNQYFANVCGR